MPHADRNRRLQYLRDYRREHPDRRSRTEYQRARRERLRQFVRDQKDRPCADCGGRFPHFVMDFHHRDPTGKECDVGRAIAKNWTIERVAREIEKCDLVCANCHRIREFGS